MATEVISIVDPDNGAGTDYTSLSAWEAGEQADLTSSDEIAIAKCRSTSGSADTSAVTLAGWTTDSTRYIKIWTDPAENYRHDGQWSTSAYRIESTDDRTIYDVDGQYLVIEGLQIKATRSSTAPYCIYSSQTSGNITIDKTIFVLDTDSDGYISDIRDGVTATITNCIAYGAGTGTGARGFLLRGGAITIANCTVYGTQFSRGIWSYSSNVTAVNCVVFGTGDDFYGTFVSIDYCASDDGDGTNPVSPYGSDWDNEFTDYANLDFSILNTGNLYLGSEITQADNGSVPDDDIIGTARNTGTGEQTSIGAFEYLSSGTTYQNTAADGISLGESISNAAVLVAAALDGLNLAETPLNIASLLASISEGLSFGDAGGASFLLQVSAADGLSVGENLSNAATIRPSVVDGLTLAESITVAAILVAAASDGASLGDQAAGDIAGALVASAIDGLNLGDQAATISQIVAAVLEGITTGDSAAWQAAIEALASDGAVFSDAGAAALRLIAAAIEGVAIGEAGAVRCDFSVNCADGVSFGGVLAAVMTIAAAVAEAFSLGDIAVHIQAQGLVTVSFSASRATITFTAKKPGITIQ